VLRGDIGCGLHTCCGPRLTLNSRWWRYLLQGPITRRPGCSVHGCLKLCTAAAGFARRLGPPCSTRAARFAVILSPHRLVAFQRVVATYQRLCQRIPSSDHAHQGAATNRSPVPHHCCRASSPGTYRNLGSAAKGPPGSPMLAMTLASRTHHRGLRSGSPPPGRPRAAASEAPEAGCELTIAHHKRTTQWSPCDVTGAECCACADLRWRHRLPTDVS
jgi:hypothetical protein